MRASGRGCGGGPSHRCGWVDAALSLHGLHEHCAHGVVHLGQRGDVVEGQERDVLPRTRARVSAGRAEGQVSAARTDRSGANGARIAGLCVSDSEPIERPWKPPVNATALGRGLGGCSQHGQVPLSLRQLVLPAAAAQAGAGVAAGRACLRANLRAASLASVPLLQKYTWRVRGRCEAGGAGAGVAARRTLSKEDSIFK